MKSLLTFFLLSITLSATCQIQFAEYSKQLLIEPSFSESSSAALTNYYIEEYQFLKRDLEKEYALATTNEIRDPLYADIEKIEEVLNLWLEEGAGIEQLDFLANYKEEYCYELESSDRLITSKEIKVVVHPNIDSVILIVEQIKFKQIVGKEEWIKKKKSKDCFSQNPEDCYVACWVKTADKNIVRYQEEEILIGALPINFTYDAENEVLERQIEFFPLAYEITDEEGNEIMIAAWKEVDCN